MASSSSSTTEDDLTCQRCRQPLILDPSLSNLTPNQYGLITSSLPQHLPPPPLSPASKLAALPPHSRQSAALWAQANGIPLPSGPGPSGAGVAESFILLGDSTYNLPLPPTPSSASRLSNNATLATNLHEILSSRTPVSHPLCTDCTGLLQSELQKELEELSRERDAYLNFERGILRNREQLRANRNRDPALRRGSAAVDDHVDEEALGEYDIEGDDEEWESLERRKSELEEEEEKLKVILQEKELELEKAKAEEKRIREEEAELDRQETEFMLSHAALSTDVDHLSAELATARTRLLLSTSLLAHLEATNVYNDAFQIGHVPLYPDSSASTKGASSISVGTINGLRLGGRPVVDWEEINAAWGLVGLCVDRIAVKVGCVFERYKIVPLGSFSRVEELPPGKNVYELYVSSDMTPSRILQNRRFNSALVAMLDCIKQLVEHGRRHNRAWGMGNIEIHKDRISSHSIRLPGLSSMPLLPSMSIMGLGGSSTENDSAGSGSGSSNGAGGVDSTGEENWTRACRAVLQVLKRILVVESEGTSRA